ncbi:hypothetical protein [Streptomyces sp. NPDC058751]|uniref:hypothetical protein n=1 Tax=Streptomyces sp. NPDC058751 TaxID=3346623 RepID=UPI0036CB23ED
MVTQDGVEDVDFAAGWRDQGLVVWGTLGRLMVLGRLPEVGRFLPDGAQRSVLGDRLTFPSGLETPYGLLILVARGAGPTLPAQWRFARRDV